MSGEASEVEGKESTDPHRVHPGAAADLGAQLPQVPLPVGAGAAHHRLGAAPLRDPGQDLVSEQTHQVEEGAAAGEGGRGGTRLHTVLLLASCRLLISDLQSSLLPAAHSAPAVCASAAGALSSLLNVVRKPALRD